MNIIESVLATNPQARNSDIVLILEVWAMEGVALSPNQVAKIKSATRPETIRRTRQKLQEEGKYLASKQVQEKRKEIERSFKI